MNIKTKLPEEYVKFVDSPKKQNTYFEINTVLFFTFVS